ncbi:MAG TPA: methionyl-tRNA formyltransferase [Ignavibacteriaceae bacterium]|nr:methionyl-tRNA formyltransferase [Ignavibacteriaceae bacterium]
MKLIFLGTPDFAVPSLVTLIGSRHQVLAVVTGADKERGRGQKVSYTPVKHAALQNKIPVLQPESLKDLSFINQLKAFHADLFVVVAFRILPKEVFTLPQQGSFNLHASLLPKYRGAAPIQWALINGDKETGVTTFSLEEKVDTGGLYLQKKIEIEDEDDFGTLHDKLSELGAEAVLETVDLIESGSFRLIHQDNSKATPAPKITPETGKIDWGKPAEEIHNLIRGLSPVPAAYFFYDDKKIKIFKTRVEKKSSTSPGKFIISKTNFFVECGENRLEILDLQLEGKRRLNAEEFLRGYRFN